MTPGLESCIGFADTFLADHESRVGDTDHVPHVPSQDWCLIVCISCIPMKSLAILPSHCNPKIPIWLHKSQSITSNEQLNFQNIHSTLMTTQHSHNCINYAFTICSWQYSQSYWVPDPGYQTSCLHCLTVFANNGFDTMVIAHISCAHRAGLCSFPVLPWVTDATSTPTLRTGRIHMLSLSSYTLNCLLKRMRHAWWIVLPLLDVRQHESFSHFDEKLSPSEKVMVG